MPNVLTSTSSGSSPLIGRAVESAALRTFLERTQQHGAVLLLTGHPGVGKSALLDAAAQEAVAWGATVLRAAGVEFEAEVSFAALNQLLLPLLGDLEALPAVHRDGLLVALGLGAGPPPPPLLVSAAVLELVRHTAVGGPVLLLVDDVPWLDRSSAQVLGFVARRLEPSRVGLLAAARSADDCLLLHAGLPQHEVPPLDEDAARQLLQSRFPGLGPEIGRRVLSASAGNPLALLELPAVMTDAQRSGFDGLPAALPLSSHLQAAFAHQLVRLPAAARRLLLLAALDGSGDLATLRAAAGEVDGWLDDLAPAETAGLVRIDLGTRRVILRHPLIGSAAVELSTSGERRRAHGALADALVDHPEQCAWHLAQAVVGVDARAADLLALAADRARRKGDAVRAVTALLQAASLSATGAARARRLAEAAFVGADTTGALRDVPHLLSEARNADPGTTGSLEVVVAATHHLLNGEGDLETAHLMLYQAIEHTLGEGPGAASTEDALHNLMLICHFGGRDELWRPFEAAMRLLGPDAPPVLSIAGSVFADPARATAEALDHLDELIGSAYASADATHVVRVGIAAFYADRLASCRDALRGVVRDGEAGGAVASAVNALMMLCHEALDGGRWEEAQQTATRGIAWGEGLGYRLITLPGVYCCALLAAARGDDETAQRLADDLVDWSAPRGVHLLESFAHRVRALAALGRGEFEDAYGELTAISPAGSFAPYAPVAVCVAMDLVESAVRTGRRSDAAAHVAAMERAPVFARTPRLALVRAGSAALAAPAEEAVQRFEEALAIPGIDRCPFERARVHLGYGEHLRRTRATNAARRQLTRALEIFEWLGARPWIARARSELQATGLGHRRSAAEDRATALTAQEQQIAMLAATGLSNKQIGSRLYLSPRTVGAHLYRIFPKLGITSRAALRDALDGSPAG